LTFRHSFVWLLPKGIVLPDTADIVTFATYTQMMQKNQPTLIYGRHPVVDAARSGAPIDKIFLQQGTRGELEKELRHLCRELDIPLQVAPKERLDKFTKGNHQGVLAFLSLITYHRIEDVLPGVYEQGEVPLLLMLDGVTDVRNFGAIARSAECCGVHAIIIPQKGSAQINADAMKASAGALSKIPVCREGSLVNVVNYLRSSGVRLLAADLEAKRPVFQTDLTVPVALVMGAEDEGISHAVARMMDERFIIPQKGSTDSFNVSVAAGIALYEVLRQRFGS